MWEVLCQTYLDIDNATNTALLMLQVRCLHSWFCTVSFGWEYVCQRKHVCVIAIVWHSAYHFVSADCDTFACQNHECDCMDTCKLDSQSHMSLQWLLALMFTFEPNWYLPLPTAFSHHQHISFEDVYTAGPGTCLFFASLQAFLETQVSLLGAVITDCLCMPT